MLYDVFVVGAKDAGPVAQMHLSARLADHFHASAVQIAQAIASRNLRAGQGLDEAQARILSDQLAALGAVTELRPAVGRRPTGTVATAAPGMVAGTGQHTAAVPRTVASAGAHAAVAPRTVAGVPAHVAPPTQGMALAPLGLQAGPPTLGAATAVVPGGDIVGRDPFAQSTPGPLGGASSGSPTITSTLPSLTSVGTRAAPAPGGRDPFAPPTGDLPRLELAPRGGKAASPAGTVAPEDGPTPQPSFSHDGAGPARLSADGADSGVALADGKVHMVRCAEHGLYYDKRTASGCRKCLAPARQRAAKMTDQSLTAKATRLRDNPMKHALVGLAIALFIGLVPAALHALGVGVPEVNKLRQEQVELSRQIGTQAVLQRFHELDGRMRDVHGTHMRNTALIWVGLTGLSLFGWYRLT